MSCCGWKFAKKKAKSFISVQFIVQCSVEQTCCFNFIFVDKMFKLINGRGQSENSSKAKILRKGTYAFSLLSNRWFNIIIAFLAEKLIHYYSISLKATGLETWKSSIFYFIWTCFFYIQIIFFCFRLTIPNWSQ